MASLAGVPLQPLSLRVKLNGLLSQARVLGQNISAGVPVATSAQEDLYAALPEIDSSSLRCCGFISTARLPDVGFGLPALPALALNLFTNMSRALLQSCGADAQQSGDDMPIWLSGSSASTATQLLQVPSLPAGPADRARQALCVMARGKAQAAAMMQTVHSHAGKARAVASQVSMLAQRLRSLGAADLTSAQGLAASWTTFEELARDIAGGWLWPCAGAACTSPVDADLLQQWVRELGTGQTLSSLLKQAQSALRCVQSLPDLGPEWHGTAYAQVRAKAENATLQLQADVLQVPARPVTGR